LIFLAQLFSLLMVHLSFVSIVFLTKHH